MLCSMDYSYECAQCSPKGQQSFERQKPSALQELFYNVPSDKQNRKKNHTILIWEAHIVAWFIDLVVTIQSFLNFFVKATWHLT